MAGGCRKSERALDAGARRYGRMDGYAGLDRLKKHAKVTTEAIAQANADLGRQQIALAAERTAQIARDLLKAK